MLQLIKKTLLLSIMLVFAFVSLPYLAVASVPFQGEFTANNNCEALLSIRKGTNPGNVTLEVGKTYSIIAQNKENPTHYQLQVDGAEPSERWVAINCGSIARLPPQLDSSTIVFAPKDKEYLLALSWQPAFCEGKPDKSECERLKENPDRFEATHFVLHGLWPQPKSNVFCNVSRRNIELDEGKNKDWSKLPPVEDELSPETWEKLQVVMPGTLSYLHRHEWIKHGTCYNGSPEEYFTEAMALLDEFNKSPVQQLVAQNISNKVTVNEIDEALSSFGESTGNKVEIKCKDSLLGELWVNLEGDINLTTPVSDLLDEASPAKTEKFTSCVIDSARD